MKSAFVIVFLQALSLHPSVVNSMNLWALCGMGYTLGQFFQLKFVLVLKREEKLFIIFQVCGDVRLELFCGED